MFLHMVFASVGEQIVGLGMTPHVRRGVGAQRTNCLVPLSDVGEDATHQLGSKVLAPMLMVGFDVGDRHHAITQREVGEPDDRSVEQQLVPIAVRADFDGQTMMLCGSHLQSLAGGSCQIPC